MRKLCQVFLTTLFLASIAVLQAVRQPAPEQPTTTVAPRSRPPAPEQPTTPVTPRSRAKAPEQPATPTVKRTRPAPEQPATPTAKRTRPAPEQPATPTAKRTRPAPEQPATPTAKKRVKTEPTIPQLTLKVDETQKITVPNNGTITEISGAGADFVTVADNSITGDIDTEGIAYDITINYSYTETTGRGVRATTEQKTGSLAYKVIVGEVAAPEPKIATKELALVLGESKSVTLDTPIFDVSVDSDDYTTYFDIKISDDKKTITFITKEQVTTKTYTLTLQKAKTITERTGTARSRTTETKIIGETFAKISVTVSIPNPVTTTASFWADESAIINLAEITGVVAGDTWEIQQNVNGITAKLNGTVLTLTTTEPMVTATGNIVCLNTKTKQKVTINVEAKSVITASVTLQTTDAQQLVVNNPEPKIVFTQTLSEIISKANLTNAGFKKEDVVKVTTDIKTTGLSTIDSSPYGISIDLYNYLANNPVSLKDKTFTVELQSKTHKAKVTFNLTGPTYENGDLAQYEHDDKIVFDNAAGSASGPCRLTNAFRVGWWVVLGNATGTGLKNKLGRNLLFIINTPASSRFDLLDNFLMQEGGSFGEILTNMDNIQGNWVGFGKKYSNENDARTAASAGTTATLTVLSLNEDKKTLKSITVLNATIPGNSTFDNRTDMIGIFPEC